MLFRDQQKDGKITKKSMDILGKGIQRAKLESAIHSTTETARVIGS